MATQPGSTSDRRPASWHGERQDCRSCLDRSRLGAGPAIRRRGQGARGAWGTVGGRASAVETIAAMSGRFLPVESAGRRLT